MTFGGDRYFVRETLISVFSPAHFHREFVALLGFALFSLFILVSQPCPLLFQLVRTSLLTAVLFVSKKMIWGSRDKYFDVGMTRVRRAIEVLLGSSLFLGVWMHFDGFFTLPSFHPHFFICLFLFFVYYLHFSFAAKWPLC